MKKSLAILTGVFICVFLAGSVGKESAYKETEFQSTALSETSSLKETRSLQADPAFGKMPLYFIRNQGQVDGRVDYYVQGKDKTIYFTSEGLTYVLSERKAEEEKGEEAALMKERSSMSPAEHKLKSPGSMSRWVVKLDFIGANPGVRPVGEEQTGAVISYFRGSPEDWKTGLPTYSRKELISTAAKRVLNLKSEGKSFEEILAAKPITDLLENSWIPESVFIYCIYYKPKT